MPGQHEKILFVPKTQEQMGKKPCGDPKKINSYPYQEMKGAKAFPWP